MTRKTIKIENTEVIIGIPYTFIKVFAVKNKDINTDDGNIEHVRISPYDQWNAFMRRKVNEGNRIIQNVNFTKIYGDDDPDHAIAVKFEVIYTE